MEVVQVHQLLLFQEIQQEVKMHIGSEGFVALHKLFFVDRIFGGRVSASWITIVIFTIVFHTIIIHQPS